MERRKFVIGLGALASGTAAAVGTGAFNVARADREISVATAGDESAYLGLEATSEYATGTSDGELSVTIEKLGEDSNYVFNDVFKIMNNGEDNIIIDLSDSTDDISWDTNYPKVYWTEQELGTDQNVGGKGEFNNTRPILAPGEYVYAQFEFVGRDAEDGGNPDDAPDVIGIYAEATDTASTVSNPDDDNSDDSDGNDTDTDS